MRRSTERGLVVALLLVTTAYAIAEEVTLTTYYPSPRGMYEDLRASGTVGIGRLDAPIAPLNVMAENTAGADRADQVVIQGKTNPNLKLNLGIHTEVATPYADIGFVEEAVAWRDLVLAKNGGNVGIGTASPAGRLHVQGADNAASVVAFMPGADSPAGPPTPSISVGIGTTTPKGTLNISSGKLVIGDGSTNGANTYLETTPSSPPGPGANRPILEVASVFQSGGTDFKTPADLRLQPDTVLPGGQLLTAGGIWLDGVRKDKWGVGPADRGFNWYVARSDVWVRVNHGLDAPPENLLIDVICCDTALAPGFPPNGSVSPTCPGVVRSNEQHDGNHIRWINGTAPGSPGILDPNKEINFHRRPSDGNDCNYFKPRFWKLQ